MFYGLPKEIEDVMYEHPKMMVQDIPHQSKYVFNANGITFGIGYDPYDDPAEKFYTGDRNVFVWWSNDRAFPGGEGTVSDIVTAMRLVYGL